MTDVSQFVRDAELACEGCDYKASNAGEAMVHALTIGHTLSGTTPDGHQITISTEDE